jgi:hypothetical protein
MADRGNKLIAQLRAEVLALQEAAAAAAGLESEAAAAATLLATEAAAVEAILVAEATAAAAAAAATAGGTPPPVVFTLAPALANTTALLDLTSPSGTKHFKGATECLNSHPSDFLG